MTKELFMKKLKIAFAENGYSDLLNEEACEKLFALATSLVETNKTTNLTAITDADGIILKHFLDSVTVCRHIPKNSTVIDVGCGAGFPSLPLAVLRPDILLTALDSTGKKIDYVSRVAKELGLNNISAVCARAEDHVGQNREIFDVCTSRAVARLNLLSELCLPFVRIGGRFLPMKAANKGGEELAEAKRGIGILGGKASGGERLSLTLDEQTIEREIFMVEKVKQTPSQYPRAYAQILKKPL